MSLPIYPTLPGLTFNLLKSAEFDTLQQVASNKYETDLPQTVNPLWRWELIYDFLRDFPYGSFTAVSELRTLLDFFLARQGRAGTFLFLDADDNYVGPAMVGSSPNVPMAQLQVVTDGAGNYYSPLQRTLGGSFYEDVTDLNTDPGAGGSALAIYANGVLKTSGGSTPDYTLSSAPGLALPDQSFMGLYVKWAAEPATPVTAQFNFYFRVRFEMDSQDIEKFSNALWTIGGSESQKGSGQIKLQQARPAGL